MASYGRGVISPFTPQPAARSGRYGIIDVDIFYHGRGRGLMPAFDDAPCAMVRHLDTSFNIATAGVSDAA